MQQQVRLLLLSLMTIAATAVWGQKDSIDTGRNVVAYRYACNTTTADGEAAVDSFMLAVIKGERITYCGEYHWTMLEMVGEKSRDLMLGEFEARRHNVPAYYINREENTMTTFDKIIPERYVVEGECPDIRWTISEDTTTIDGFLCHKAEGRYAGRNWLCWFAEDIPLTVGPWKLGGLPGLILKAEDGEGVHHFAFAGLLNRDVRIFHNKGFGERKTISATDFIKRRNRILCDKRYAHDPRYYLTPDMLQNAREVWAGGPEPPAEAKQTMLARDMIVPKTAYVFQPLELE
ncbi:MAG: GLPGLI family protein [Bacteroidaceae bacterium]|nr:GLPGLI family protein [Bacteroidaceae bacterium]